MNDKYIIDGVKYSVGEEVEVSNDGTKWVRKYLVEVDYYEDDSYRVGCIGKQTYHKYIRKIQPKKTNKERVIEYLDGAIKQGTTLPVMAQNLAYIFDEIYENRTQSLSGQKAKLTLGDGTELNVTIK